MELSPNKFLMVMPWEDVASIKKFAGETWEQKELLEPSHNSNRFEVSVNYAYGHGALSDRRSHPSNHLRMYYI